MITLSEAQEYLRMGAVLIDVRDREEYLSGHLDNAINIPVSNIFSISNRYSKDTYIIVYCKSGRRSRMAATQLINEGYKNVFNLEVEL